MNRKIGMFFLSVTLMVNDSYSQEAFDAYGDDTTEQLELTPSDQLTLSHDDKADTHDYEHTSDDLKQIAEHEANNDLSKFPEMLDEKKPTMDEANSDLIKSPEVFDEKKSTIDALQPSINVSADSDSQAVEPEDDSVIEGIDTVDLDQPQGNWLFKRIWWERSEARYEKIKKKIEEIFENRMIFFEKRSELVKNILDPFYLKIGMGQGEFQAILEDYIHRLEAEREKKGSLTPQEREMLTKLDNEREALEQLVVDVQAIGEVENRVDESLSRLLEQLGAIRRYDKQAWDAFKEIARVVDDEKARQLYQVVDTALNNIKDIGDYLEHAFAAHFDQLIATAKEQTERVTTIVAGLKEKGIDLKKRIDQLINQQSATKKEQEKKAQEKKVAKEEAPEEEQGFLSSYILNPLATAWDGVVWVVTWPYYALFVQKEEQLEANEE